MQYLVNCVIDSFPGHRYLQSLCGYPGKTWLCCIWCTIAESVFCHYTVCYMYICARIYYMQVTTCLRIRSLCMMWVRIIWNNPGNAWVCPGLQAPMHWPPNEAFHHLQCSFCKRSRYIHVDRIVFTASQSEDKLCQYTFELTCHYSSYWHW